MWPWVAVVLALCLAFLLARSRSWARRRVVEATRDLRALNDFHRALLADLDLREVLGRVARAVAPGLGFSSAIVYLYDPVERTLVGEIGHAHEGDVAVSSIRLDLDVRGPLQAAMFGPPEGVESPGMIALPMLGPTPEGANARCWLEPEARCTVIPRATSATRRELCPGCPNFAPLGVLEADFEGVRPARARSLRDFARAAALAVQNARLFGRAEAETARARRQLAQLELIHEVGQEVGRSLEADAILERLVRGLHDRLGYSRASVALTLEGRVRGHMTFVDGRTRWTEGVSNIDYDIHDHRDPFAQVARTGDPLVIRDAGLDSRLPSQVRANVRTIGYVPIVAPGSTGSSTGGRDSVEVLGVLSVDHGPRRREIDRADLEVLRTLGAQVGVALQNAREYELLRERERDALALAELAEALAQRAGDAPGAPLPAIAEDPGTSPLFEDLPGAPSQPAGTDLPGEWLDRACDALAALARADFATLTRLAPADDGGPALTMSVASSLAGRDAYRSLAPTRRDSLTRAALEAGEPIVVADASLDPRATDEAELHGPAALLVLPLAAAGRGLGALILGRAAAWSREDAARLETVAGQVVLALENHALDRSLRDERRRLADALENLADGVLLVERRGGRQAGLANRAARELLGLPESFDPASLPAQILANVDQDGGSLAVGGARLQVAVTRRGELTIVVLQDLARFQAVEQAKAELLSVVSHELRTPLTAIIGFTDLLLTGAAGPLTGDQTEFLRTTLDASQRLHQTVLNLLDASRLEAGQFELNLRPARLDLSATLERYARAAREKNLELEARITPTSRLVLDAARLELVVANLLSNALRYTPEGGKLLIEGGVEGGNLRLSVADTGPGMSEEQVQNLFRRFARGTGNRDALEGAGLSLYVSRAIAVAHGGSLWAESAPGQGTRMHLAVPAVSAVEASAA